MQLGPEASKVGPLAERVCRRDDGERTASDCRILVTFGKPRQATLGEGYWRDEPMSVTSPARAPPSLHTCYASRLDPSLKCKVVSGLSVRINLDPETGIAGVVGLACLTQAVTTRAESLVVWRRNERNRVARPGSQFKRRKRNSRECHDLDGRR